MSAPRRSGRRPVFDPTALDDLDSTLAPPEPAPAPVPEAAEAPEQPIGRTDDRTTTEPANMARPAPADRSSSSGNVERASGPGRARAAVTSGSRSHTPTTRQPRSTRGRIPTAVRLPADLYLQVNEVLLSGPERPSYGQLVMWTVEDHREQVAAQVEADLPDPSDRVPRGRKLAQDRMPVGLQLLGSERDDLDNLAAEVAARNEGTRVTRTDVAIAALRVALRSWSG